MAQISSSTKDLRSIDQQSYGIKTVRQLKSSLDHTSTGGRHRSIRQLKQVELAYNYFTQEVDPIIGDCVTYLLRIQPDDVVSSMLIYLKKKLNNDTLETRPEKLSKAKVSQKSYLTSQITPILSHIVSMLARERPKNVTEYICVKLEDIRKMGGIPSVRKNEISSTNAASSHYTRPSTARSKLMEAKELANNFDDPLQLSFLKVQRPESAPVPKSDNNNLPSFQVQHDSFENEAMLNIQILFLGLNNTGKTSYINCLEGKAGVPTKPSVGFRPVSMMLGDNLKVKLYDIGGGPKIRNIWNLYFHDAHGILYFFDLSADEEDMRDAIAHCFKTISHPYLKGKPIAIIANKRDKTDQPSIALELFKEKLEMEYLHLNTIVGKMHVFECCSFPSHPEDPVDPQIESSMEWILEAVKKDYTTLHTRVLDDTKTIKNNEEKVRVQKDMKVLKKKIAHAFPHEVDRTLYDEEELPQKPDDVFTEEEAFAFLAAEVGVELSDFMQIQSAVDIVRLVGCQRLAMQMVGAMFAPINKKRTPMSWDDIKKIIVILRSELGLS